MRKSDLSGPLIAVGQAATGNLEIVFRLTPLTCIPAARTVGSFGAVVPKDPIHTPHS